MEVVKYALSSKEASASRVGVGAAAWRSELERAAIRFSTGDGSRCAARALRYRSPRAMSQSR